MKLCQVSEDQGRVEEAEPGYNNWPRYLEGKLAQSSFGLWPAAGEECVEYCKTWFTLLVQEISRSARLGTLLRSEHRWGKHNTEKKVQSSPAKIGYITEEGIRRRHRLGERITKYVVSTEGTDGTDGTE